MNRRVEIENETNSKKNLSNTFVLPMVGINYKTLPKNFVNSYITEEYQIILVFDKTEYYDAEFALFFDHVRTNIRHYNFYEDNEDELVIYLDIPDIFKSQFEIFMRGKYSKFSEPYKNVIKNFFGQKTIIENHKATEWNVIYPQDGKRKQIAEWLSSEVNIVDYRDIKEVLSIPDMSKELYKPIDMLIAMNIKEPLKTTKNS